MDLPFDRPMLYLIEFAAGLRRCKDGIDVIIRCTIVVRHRGDVSVAHERLAEDIDAMICEGWGTC